MTAPHSLSADISAKFSVYEGLLKKWQPVINLVGPATMGDVRARHFDDSLALSACLPDGARVVDVGSGGGFPALVLAIARPECSFVLVESDARKCVFLELVSRETGCRNVRVVNARLDAAAVDLGGFDVMTARALAPLPVLFDMALSLDRRAGFFAVFPKGRQWREEVVAARAGFLFDVEPVPHGEGAILLVRNLSSRTPCV